MPTEAVISIIGGFTTMLCFAGSIFGLIYFIRSRINPVWTVKEIDLKRGVVLEVKNKRNYDFTVKFFQIHTMVPSVKGEAFIALEDFPLKPNEAVEVCVKLHAEIMPEVGTNLSYSTKSSTAPGGLRNLLYKSGKIQVVSSSKDDEKATTGNIEVSTVRPSFSQFFLTPSTDSGCESAAINMHHMAHSQHGFARSHGFNNHSGFNHHSGHTNF